MPHNHGLLALTERLGFRSTPVSEEGAIKVYLPLADSEAAAREDATDRQG